MSWFGTFFGSWFGSWFGTTTGGGAVVPPSGPDGRLIAIPYNDPTTLSLTWSTDVIPAVDGTEHRAKNMGAPRRALSLAFTLETDTELDELRAELYRFPDDLRLIPLRYDDIRINTIADTDLSVTPGALDLCDWANAGQRVYIYNTDGEGYEAVLQSAVADVIGVDVSPSGGTFHDRETFIAPLAPGYLDDGNQIAREQVNAGVWAARFEVTEFQANAPIGVTVSTFDGNYLLRDDIVPELDGGGPVPEKVSAGIETADFGAAFRARTLVSSPNIPRTYAFSDVGREARQWWMALLWNLAGSFETVLMPTFREDYQLAADPTGTNQVFIVAELGGALDYLTQWFPSTGHRYFRFEYDDGTILYRKVTAVLDVGDGTQRLTFSSAVPAGAVARIMIAEVCRLAGDEVSIVFSSGDRLDLTLDLVAVQQ